MYNKCGYTWILRQNLEEYLRATPLVFNCIIPLKPNLPLESLDAYNLYESKFNRRCTCRSMIRFRTRQRQMSTDGMLIKIVHDVCANFTHFNNVHL